MNVRQLYEQYKCNFLNRQENTYENEEEFNEKLMSYREFEEEYCDRNGLT